MIGKVVSHYKIISKLGEGGMGEVYKAEDINLKRIVALKFLPLSFSSDKDAKKRFISEAQTASTLQHNNICTIHNIDETDDGRIFICMDYYEGQTLKEKIGHGALKVNEATEIIIQIAAGLQKAHDKGIIHRDIKPANIFITKEGIVKILDFGLAKLAGRTLMTKIGTTVGTVAYMSPEQAHGKEVDIRTDIWSLGVVLYEMLTARLPFPGEFDQAIIYQILNENPEPIKELLPDLPPEYATIINRCLEKEPQNRLQSVLEMVNDLKGFSKQYDGISHSNVQSKPLSLRAKKLKTLTPVFKHISKQRFKIKYLIWFATSFIVLIILVYILFLHASVKMPVLNPNAKLHSVPLPVKEVSYCALSPDGNWIAFGGADERGKWDVYFMNSSGGEVRRVTNDSSDHVDVNQISRDGSWILFDRLNSGKSEVCTVPTLGGMTKIICEGNDPKFNEINQKIFYFGKEYRSGNSSVAGCVWSINLDGSNDSMVYVDTSLIGFSFGTSLSFSLSPDGKSIAYTKTNLDELQNIITYNMSTDKETPLLFGKGNYGDLFWGHNNFLIYSKYTRNSGNFDLWIGSPGAGETLQLTQSSTVNELYGVLSDDAEKLLYYQTQRTGNIKIMNLETGKTKQLTSDDSNKWNATISPDNKYIAYISNLPGIQIMDLTNQYSIKFIANDERVYNMGWSPDGKYIAYTRQPGKIGDNGKICVITPFGSNRSKVIGETERFYASVKWLTADTLIWYSKGKIWISSIKNPHPQQLYNFNYDIYLIQNRKYALFKVYYKGQNGWWLEDTDLLSDNDNYKKRKRILGDVDVAVAPNGKFMIFLSTTGELMKLLLPDGKIEHLSYRISKGSNQNYPELSIAPDGKSVVFIESVSNSKLILWENPFIWE